jgi:serine/threonine-protein phosphatase 2A regulatory subunit A
MNIICKLDLINRVIGIDLLSETLLPAIFELSQDKVSPLCFVV